MISTFIKRHNSGNEQVAFEQAARLIGGLSQRQLEHIETELHAHRDCIDFIPTDMPAFDLSEETETFVNRLLQVI